MIVLDASLAVKFVVVEVDSMSARQWFGDLNGAVVAPDLIGIEVAQALVHRINDGHLSVDDGRAALESWRYTLDSQAISLRRDGSRNLFAAAELAIALGHPVKDCLYLALVIELDCDLVTCDAKFQAKAAPVHPRVRLLAEFN